MVFSGLKLPKLIFEKESEYNGTIKIYQVGKILKLSVDGLVQSVNWDTKYARNSVWGKVAELVKKEEPAANNIMILGLGGGTMAHLISQKLPNSNITTIEIDPIMLEVANKYFELESIPNHTTIIADALRVVTFPEKFGIDLHTFNVLIVDIYCGQEFPDLGKSGTFFAGIKSILASGGLVVFNRIYLKKHQQDANMFYDSVKENYNKVKRETVAGRTNSDNVLIYGRV